MNAVEISRSRRPGDLPAATTRSGGQTGGLTGKTRPASLKRAKKQRDNHGTESQAFVPRVSDP
ncbi:MAG TPA: hypothetical protein DEB39_13385 [Planctomycetaceae bacterium]|nr:hypothetical protein [Planctomycetaceae bacterium]